MIKIKAPISSSTSLRLPLAPLKGRTRNFKQQAFICPFISPPLFCRLHTHAHAHSSMSSSSLKPYTKYEIRKRDPDPKSCALLVIDMQNYFSSMANPILPNLNTTIDLCREASMPVIFTRHCHKSTSDHGMLEEWRFGDLIFDGTPEAELMPSLYRKPGEINLLYDMIR